jgi:16S rRNA (cytosine967-C5)-methyltransferase
VEFAQPCGLSMSNLNARLVAYDLLKSVSETGAYANLELPKIIRHQRLDGRDASFATELSMGTLRWLGFLDAISEICSGRKIDRIDPPVRDVLRIGIYQLLFMRVPTHAAVDTAVSMASVVGVKSAKGFVNAVLRKVTAKSFEQWQEEIGWDYENDLDKLAAIWSHPRWEVAAFKDALGKNNSQLVDLLRTNNTAPVITLVNRTTDSELLREYPEGRWSPKAFIGTGDPSNIASVKSGLAGIQDEGSQLVVLAWLNAAVADDSGNWLDMCAGPGGKSALIAAHVPIGGTLTAVELQEHRAELVRQNLKATSANVKVVVADGTSPDFATGSYDRVLIDAPCTGLGVLRRRAESRWRRSPKDVGQLASLQRDLLRNALKSVKVGGVVGYATCSPHLAETDFVVEDILKGSSSFEVLDARQLAASIQGLRNSVEFEEITEAGPYLRLWPHLHQTDGMFLALLRRVG